MKKTYFYLVSIALAFLIIFALSTTDIANKKMPLSGYHSAAQTYVAKLYLTGDFWTKDEAKAAQWFHLAAAKGNAQAQTQLALLYASGTGVEEDFTQAIKLLGKAAKQDHGQALDLLHWMTQAAH